VLLAQADGEAQAVLGVVGQLLLLSAVKQGVRIGDIVTRRDVQGHDLERSASQLPLEERRPALTVGVDAADALVGRRHVEHDDVLGMVGEHAVHVAAVHRLGPALDQGPDLLLVIGHRSAHSSRGVHRLRPRLAPKLIGPLATRAAT
jgi:hypothetical protein